MILDVGAFPDGTPLGEIAAAYGVPIKTARRWVLHPPREGRAPGPSNNRTDVETSEVLRLFETGMSNADIARHFRCNPGTTARRLRAAGVTPRPAVNAARDAEVARRYDAGEQLSQIAAAVGLSPSGVHKSLRRQGVARSRRQRPLLPDGREARPTGRRRPDIDTSDIIAMYEAGWTIKAIAECYDCNRALVSQRLRNADVQPSR